MTIKDIVINVSNLLWTDEVKKGWVNRSAFVVQDVSSPDAAGVIGNGPTGYFDIYCGSERIEYVLIGCPVYLAAITEDGRYRMERVEKYIKERDGEPVLDVLDLPDQINGMDFQKARGFHNTPWDRSFNHPRDHVPFHTEKDNSGLWTIEGWSTVTFVIGASSAGKSFFIGKNFQDRGYAILDVFDYQQRAWKLPTPERLSAWGSAYQANKWLEEDIVGLVRQGNNVVVEQTFLRALRRIDCIDAIHKISRYIQCDVYVIMPSEEQLWKNCVKRCGDKEGAAEREFESYKRQVAETFEFPDPAEGFSRIFVVSDEGIIRQEDSTGNWTIREKARAELQEDAARFAMELEIVRQRQRRLAEAGRICSGQKDPPLDAAECGQ